MLDQGAEASCTDPCNGLTSSGRCRGGIGEDLIRRSVSMVKRSTSTERRRLSVASVFAGHRNGTIGIPAHLLEREQYATQTAPVQESIPRLVHTPRRPLCGL